MGKNTQAAVISTRLTQAQAKQAEKFVHMSQFGLTPTIYNNISDFLKQAVDRELAAYELETRKNPTLADLLDALTHD